MALLNIHYAVGLVLFAIALAAIFSARVRRIAPFVLLLQVVLGAATWWATKLVPPAPHWILALLTGGIWPMANAFERRGRPKAVVMAISALAVIVLAYVIYLGMHALRA
jgi:hypothetical protein